ncbi:cobalamin-binding protein [Rheinheimera sp. D18]|uniref:cobalamin-binding protein n=1 Tax=Rheinheimera sp. D18 TaxID=2545632 RepID=UPI001FB8462C|nr:cobalamin-binding protein [Rheinheimera sp. D18]
MSNRLVFSSIVVLFLALHSIAAQAKPQRIIALAPHITEMLYAIGAGEQLVGVSDYSDYPIAASTLPSVANYASINLEAVLALRPDLVIAWKTGNPQADIARLQQFGIKVVFSDPLTLDDIATELRFLGEVTDNTQQANAVASQFSQQLAELRAKFQHKKPVTVFFAMSTAPLSTVANNAWPQQMLHICAAQNSFASAKGDYPQVGIEQIIAAQPQVIIQAQRDNVVADFSYWQRFNTLPAVKKSQYLTVNADYLYRTTPRTLLGIKQLCEGVDSYR